MLKKKSILFILSILPFYIMAVTPISIVDYLYIQLENELDKSFPSASEVQTLISDIEKTQIQQIQLANDALYKAVTLAQPLLVAGQGELLALQALGYNSLYLYSAQRSTLGSGFISYFSSLKSQYIAQNILIKLARYLNPKAIVIAWKNQARPILVEKGLAAATPAPSENFNNDVLTLIDYEIQKLDELDFEDPIQKALAIGVLATVQFGQELAASISGSGIDLVEKFAQILQSNLDEQADLAQLGFSSEVLESVEKAIPGENAFALYDTIHKLYADLVEKLNSYGYDNPQAYIDYYYTVRPQFIEAAEGPYSD